MIICSKCRKEMVCTKTGVDAVFAQDHCYAGDLHACKHCGNEVLVTAQTPYYNADARENERSIIMDES